YPLHHSTSTLTTGFSTLSLHDALPIYEYATDSLPDNVSALYYRVKGITPFGEEGPPSDVVSGSGAVTVETVPYILSAENRDNTRSEEHTSELQSRENLVCRLLLEKKNH